MMTLDDFWANAILQIAGNPAFGNDEQRDEQGTYSDPHEWAERVVEAADALIDLTHDKFDFDRSEQPP